MISDKDAAAGWVTERWTYTGIRETTKHGLAHKWIGPNGEKLVFGKVKGSVIGGIYVVEVQREEDGEFASARLAVTWTGERERDEEKIAGWGVDERLAKTAVSRGRAERRAGGGDEFREAVAPLKALLGRSARTWQDRSAFVAMVIDELYRGR